MGCFSWMFSDTDNQYPLLIGNPGYIACPDGQFIFEPSYGGYGIFSKHDIYDLVVDWNRPHIEVLLKAKKTSIFNWPDCLIKAILISDERAQQVINDLYLPGSFMRKEWKRNLGIEIACNDEDNFLLPCPIKIVLSPSFYKYSALPPSKSDEGQGL